MSLFDCNKINLKRNSKGKEVETLQTNLKKLGFYTYSGGRYLKLDGIYGQYTESAVKSFQTKYNLKIDGVFGKESCNKLTSIVENKPADTNKTNTNNTSSTKKEEKSNDVQQKPAYVKPDYLKVVTFELLVYSDMVVLPTSELDEKNKTNVVSGGATSVNTKFDCTSIDLKKNSSGEDVKKLQTILKAKGYYTRQIDGEYGDYTVSAVKKLQKVQGNTQDGEFGTKTCNSLQKSTNTDSNNTKTSHSVVVSIKEFKGFPSISIDTEGLTNDITVNTLYNYDILSKIKQYHKTKFIIREDSTEVYSSEGYLSSIKIKSEDNLNIIELTCSGYTAFLEKTVEVEKTAKRSELIKYLAGEAGLKSNINMEGFIDSEYTLKTTKQVTAKGSSGGGLVELNGNDCSPTAPLSAWSFDISKAGGNTKIGNSTANYAVDTASMTAREAIMDVYKRFKYGRRGTGKMYLNNEYCPRSMWNKDGTIWGNCADISRLIKCVGEVHGLRVGIKHTVCHYYNLIEVDGKTYRLDLCFKDGTTGSNFGNEMCNDLTMRGGPWSK